jgi:hypothetical protein
MSDYTAPIEDIKFTLRQVAGLDGVTSMPGFKVMFGRCTS